MVIERLDARGDGFTNLAIFAELCGGAPDAVPPPRPADWRMAGLVPPDHVSGQFGIDRGRVFRIQ